MKLKLNDCCVVLAAFSLIERSPQATLPSSLKAVTAFLLARGASLVVPKPVCVAYSLAANSGRRFGGNLKRDLAVVSEFILEMQMNWRNYSLFVDKDGAFRRCGERSREMNTVSSLAACVPNRQSGPPHRLLGQFQPSAEKENTFLIDSYFL